MPDAATPRFKPFEIVTTFPLPGPYRPPPSDLHVALDQLVLAQDGASMFVPYEGNRDPDKQCASLGQLAAKKLGKGRFTVRQVEGGMRVWKGRKT